MKLPGYAIQIILTILVLVAAAARFADTNELTTPYFEGSSAMTYRHTMEVAEGRSISKLSTKGNWPEGYQPSRYRAAGLEHFTGYFYRMARYFSEIEGRPFVRRMTVWLFSLLVLLAYGLARTLWNCQVGGLIAAFLVAIYSPLVHASNGQTFDHGLYAVLVAAVHAYALLRYHRRARAMSWLTWAVSGYVMLTVWEFAPYYLAGASLFVALHPSFHRRERIWLTVPAAVAAVAAAVTLPHLTALRMVTAWPTALVVACATGASAGFVVSSRSRNALLILGVATGITLLLTPLRAGASESLPAVEYLLARLRFLFGKPVAPIALSDTVRALWGVEGAPPSAHMMLQFLIPFALFATAAVAAWRSRRPNNNTRTFITVLVFSVVAALTCLADRSAVIGASLALAVLAASAGIHVAGRKLRATLLGLGAFVVFAGAVAPLSVADPAFILARAGGFAYQDPHKFLWISSENTDRELVVFVARGTSVADAVLGTPDISSILLTFSGRTAALIAGGRTRSCAIKQADWYRQMYSTPDELYARCKEADIKWVVYSIDFLLDQSRYSPRYLAGQTSVADSSAVYRMHFDPASLTNFALVYENEHYRLFRVVDRLETVFITDHPPAYQQEVFALAGSDLETFRQRTNELLLTYNSAMRDIDAGALSQALRKLAWCVQQAPHYTLARIAIGRTLTQMGELEQARTTLANVIAYAPDNPDALYQMAYVLAQLGEEEPARNYLKILYTTTNDQKRLDKAHLLEAFIEQGIPVSP